jgi:hypothetical protein
MRLVYIYNCFLSIFKIGFPILLNILKEDHEDVELVRGALETFECIDSY